VLAVWGEERRRRRRRRRREKEPVEGASWKGPLGLKQSETCCYVPLKDTVEDSKGVMLRAAELLRAQSRL